MRPYKFVKCIFIIIFALSKTGAETVKYSAILRGTVVHANEKTVQLMDRKGEIFTVNINSQTRVMGVTPASLDDIKLGSFIGAGTVSQPNGRLTASEVHIFAQSLQGLGEGHSPWQTLNGIPGMMTNGTVTAGTLTKTDDRQLTVKYGDQQKQIQVPPETSVVYIEPAELGILTPGTYVVLFWADDPPEHREVAALILAGSNGLIPPF